jgi:hypothetical protein
MEDKVICCGVLEELDMEWMVTKDGTVLMPFIEGKDGIRYRVNYCPSCGAYVRDCVIEP